LSSAMVRRLALFSSAIRIVLSGWIAPVLTRAGTLLHRRYRNFALFSFVLGVQWFAMGMANRYALVPWLVILSLDVVGACLWIARGRRHDRQAAEGKGRRCSEPDTMQPDERTELASLLHDTVGQGLTVIALQAGNKGQQGDAQVRAIEQTAAHTMRELRGLIGQLRGAQTSHVISDECLADVVNRFRGVGLPVEFYSRGTDEKLPPQLRAGIIRIAREALSNAMKHAPHARVRVRFELAASVRLEVKSRRPSALHTVHSRGTEPSLATRSPGTGQGFRMMQRVAAHHGGQLYTVSNHHEFTVVTTFPIGHTAQIAI
jgi:signal transduction histidine kinase